MIQIIEIIEMTIEVTKITDTTIVLPIIIGATAHTIATEIDLFRPDK